MVLKIEEVDIVMFIMCNCGLGDQYTSILTVFQAYNELVSKGYKVKVCWSKSNLYFPSHISLEVLYDLSPFEQIIEEFDPPQIRETFKSFTKIERFRVFELYVKNIDNFIETRNFTSYMRSHWNYAVGGLEVFDHQFVNQDIIDISEKFIKDKDKIYGIHFRVPDGSLKSKVDEIFEMSYYGGELIRLLNFVKNNTDHNFMICSNNQNIIDLFEQNSSNVFSNKFLYNLDKHNVLNTHHQISENILIEHTKQIMAEMVSFRKCLKIYSVNTFPSNFVSYGIIHNVHNQPWNENPNKILLDIN